MTKYADVNVGLTVSFEDNGEDDLRDQAMEAAEEALGVTGFTLIEEVMQVEVLGVVRDTETPEPRHAD